MKVRSWEFFQTLANLTTDQLPSESSWVGVSQAADHQLYEDQ